MGIEMSERRLAYNEPQQTVGEVFNAALQRKNATGDAGVGSLADYDAIRDGYQRMTGRRKTNAEMMAEIRAGNSLARAVRDVHYRHEMSAAPEYETAFRSVFSGDTPPSSRWRCCPPALA